MGLTRRRFLARVAAAGGGSLAYEAMTGLGLLPTPGQTPFGLTERVSGTRVVILGAGLAGMTVAYELGKVGYDCRVLEARAAGRSCSHRALRHSQRRVCWRLHDEHEFVDAGSVRISPRGSGPQACSHAELTWQRKARTHAALMSALRKSSQTACHLLARARSMAH